jgi:16S rRNA (uracil1498-N3)-methyltransferase
MQDAHGEYEPITFDEALSVGRAFDLDAAGVRALQLRQVNVKEAFTLRDATGAYFRATLLAWSPARASASAYEKMPADPESPARITLACAVLARQRMLFVMQKATELGVARIVPMISARSVQLQGLAHEKAHAWPGQVVRAVRQCRRASVPRIDAPASVDTVLASDAWREADLRLHLDDRAAKNTGHVSLPSERNQRTRVTAVLAIGPEGGFTDEERRRFDDHHSAALRLGGRVLRAETAVLVGLTLLQHVIGDLAAG